MLSFRQIERLVEASGTKKKGDTEKSLENGLSGHLFIHY